MKSENRKRVKQENKQIKQIKQIIQIIGIGRDSREQQQISQEKLNARAQAEMYERKLKCTSTRVKSSSTDRWIFRKWSSR